MNTSLTDERCIEVGNMGDVHGLGPLPDSTLVVAADDGLYHITPEGTPLQIIAQGKKEGVQIRDAIVCALSRSDNDTPSNIIFYTYYDKLFTKTISLQLPFTSGKPITISLGHNVIYAANPIENCIYVLSLDGSVRTKHGRSGRGGAGELSFPHAAATDAHEYLLVCDNRNHRLQVMTHEGEWRLLKSDSEMKRPRVAIVVDRKVFVGGGSESCYISVFDIHSQIEFNERSITPMF